MVSAQSPSASVIKQLDLTLLWPLHVIEREDIAENAWLKRCADALEADARWQPVIDRYSHGRSAEQSYSELVYFHPFVQRFLYSKDSPDPPLRIFERTDIQGLRVDLGRDGNQELGSIDFKVPRLRLYLFDLRIAIVVCEIFTVQDLPIRTAQAVLDRVRRGYPPYWDSPNPASDGSGSESLGGHCPRSCRWLPERNDMPAAFFGDPAPYLGFVERHLSPPIADHWKQILAPLTIAGDPDAGSWTLRQLEDDRIPLMAHVAVSDPSRLTPGDFARLAFADEPGASDSLPYATEFLADFERRYCYDRYWEKSGNPAWMKTRYLCAGYTFVMVGDATDSKFFMDADRGGLSHFRNHYLQMGLIAHFHRAALLSIADQLSECIAGKPMHSDGFRERAGAIMERLLRFTHRYWFNEISNQVQARELFGWWSGHLETRRLFDQVSEEARGINAYLDTREQERQTGFTTRLTVVAALGIAVAVIATLIPPIGVPGLTGSPNAHWPWSLTRLVALSLLGVWLLYLISGPLARSLTRRSGQGD